LFLKTIALSILAVFRIMLSALLCRYRWWKEYTFSSIQHNTRIGQSVTNPHTKL